MTPRLASGLLVAAMLRRVGQAGGFAVVIWRGDEDAGGVLVSCCDRGVETALLERSSDTHGNACWRDVGPDEQKARDTYLEKRRHQDPDLWLIELDIPDAARFAAEMIAPG